MTGLTWTKTADGPGPNTAIYAEELLVNGSTVIATRFTNTGELFHSINSGESWQLATGIPNNSSQPIGANGGVMDLARDGSTYYCQVLPQGPVPSTAAKPVARQHRHRRQWFPHPGPQDARCLRHPSQLRPLDLGQSRFILDRPQHHAHPQLRFARKADHFRRPSRSSPLTNSTPSVLSAVAGEGTAGGIGCRPAHRFPTQRPRSQRNRHLQCRWHHQSGRATNSLRGPKQQPGLSWSPLSATGLVGPETTWHYASELCVHNGYLYAATYSLGGTHRFVRLALTNGEYPQAPVFVTQPTPSTLTAGAGDSATFQALASGSGTLTYQWRKNATPLDGKTSPTLTLTNLQPGDAGNYTVAVTNGTETVISNPAVLTVSPADPGKLDFSFDAPISKVFFGTTLFGGTAYKVWPQADGKILVAGDFDRVAVTPGNPFPTGGTPCTQIARFTATGALDPDFTLGTVATGGVIKALAVQPDGKILIGGYFHQLCRHGPQPSRPSASEWQPRSGFHGHRHRLQW